MSGNLIFGPLSISVTIAITRNLLVERTMYDVEFEPGGYSYPDPSPFSG